MKSEENKSMTDETSNINDPTANFLAQAASAKAAIQKIEKNVRFAVAYGANEKNTIRLARKQAKQLAASATKPIEKK